VSGTYGDTISSIPREGVARAVDARACLYPSLNPRPGVC